MIRSQDRKTPNDELPHGRFLDLFFTCRYLDASECCQYLLLPITTLIIIFLF